MAETIYLLCTIASIVCALPVARSYFHSRSRILLWAMLCFGLLAVNNLLLFADLVVWPDTDLSAPRLLTSFGAIALLVFGLAWDSR